MGATSSLKSLVNLDKKDSLFSNAVRGIGVGTLANVADKKLLAGRLSSIGLGIGQNINGKPVTINATDALTWFAVSGFKFKLSTKELITILSTIGVKKYFELMDYIDPYEPMPVDSPNATNVTRARTVEKQREMFVQSGAWQYK